MATNTVSTIRMPDIQQATTARSAAGCANYWAFVEGADASLELAGGSGPSDLIDSNDTVWAAVAIDHTTLGDFAAPTGAGFRIEDGILIPPDPTILYHVDLTFNFNIGLGSSAVRVEGILVDEINNPSVVEVYQPGGFSSGLTLSRLVNLDPDHGPRFGVATAIQSPVPATRSITAQVELMVWSTCIPTPDSLG